MRLALAGFLALAALPAIAAPLTFRDVVTGAVDGYIRPGFAQLAEETASLGTHVAVLCATPSTETLETVRSQFKSAVIAYSRVEFVKFGPLADDNRAERLFFWPDRKGIALKQVQAILAQQDATATSTDTLMGKSVAAQGLGALEFVLFGSGAEALAGPDGSYRCSYASAIAGALSQTSAQLSAEWADPDGIGKRLENPDATDLDYRTNTEVLEELTGAIAHGIEAIRDVRLKPILGAVDSPPKPKSAAFWRSNLTFPSIRANFEGLADFFTLSHLGEAAGADFAWIDRGVKFEFDNAMKGADAVPDPVETALNDPKQRKAMDYTVIITGQLQELIGTQLSKALGLSVGFSSLDGD